MSATATTFLLWHVWYRQLIRQISVTRDFNPGTPRLNYFALTDEIRSAVGYHVQQLNRNSPDPRHAVWACRSIYLLRGELCFIAECLTSNPRPMSHRGWCIPFSPHSLPAVQESAWLRAPCTCSLLADKQCD